MKYLGKSQNSADVITKGYGDNNYASQSQMTNISNDLLKVTLSAKENEFRAKSLLASIQHDLEYLCIETFDTSNDIDTTVADGAKVINDYYKTNSHSIIKKDATTVTFQSKSFSLDRTPYTAIILLDYEGDGSVTLQFSKNNGEDWKTLNNNELTDINVLVQKSVRIRLIVTGSVTINNIAWGTK